MTLPNDPLKIEEYLKKLSEAKKGKPSWNKGKKMGESTKQKLRECNIGRKQSPETIEKRISKTSGENHWNYGKHWNHETIVKMSNTKIGMYAGEKNPFFGKHHAEESLKCAVESRKLALETHPEIRNKMSLKGKNNPRWKGGISFEPYCIKFNNKFRERVRAFFDYQCIECGTPQNGYKLAVHHVNFRKDSCCSEDAPRLFVPLCPACHAKTNSKRKHWEEHFTKIINTYYGGKCYFTESEMEQRINI